MYFNDEYTWQQFKNLDDIRRLPLQEQISRYNRYLGDLSVQRSLVEAYVNPNLFQSFQSNTANAAGSGGDPITTTSTTTTTTTATPTTTTTTTSTTTTTTTVP